MYNNNMSMFAHNYSNDHLAMSRSSFGLKQTNKLHYAILHNSQLNTFLSFPTFKEIFNGKLTLKWNVVCICLTLNV